MEDNKKKLDKNLSEVLHHFEDFYFNKDARTIHLIGSIEEGCFRYFDIALTILEQESRKAITVKISTYGGDTYETNAIIGRMQASPCKIITEGYGPVMSSGILLLASGDRRRLSRYAILMHHSVSYDMAGTHHYNLDYVKQAELEENRRYEWLAEKSSATADYWKSLAERRDYYMTPKEALNCGLIDELF